MENTDLVRKFETYKTLMDNVYRKYEESEAVAERLKDDLKLSVEVEKHLRIQLAQTASRLIDVQKTCNQIIIIKERSVTTESRAADVENKLVQLTKEFQEVREISKNLLTSTKQEIELLQVVENLKHDIRKKESDSDLLHMEIQTLTKEKSELMSKYEGRIRELLDELNTVKQTNCDVTNQSDKVHNTYRQQIAEYEVRIEQYEKERQGGSVTKQMVRAETQSILKKGTASEGNGKVKCRVSWGDNTVSTFSDEQVSGSPIDPELDSSEDAVPNSIECESNHAVKETRTPQVLSYSIKNGVGEEKRLCYPDKDEEPPQRKSDKDENAAITTPNAFRYTVNPGDFADTAATFQQNIQVEQSLVKKPRYSNIALKPKLPVHSFHGRDQESNGVKRRQLYSTNSNHFN